MFLCGVIFSVDYVKNDLYTKVDQLKQKHLDNYDPDRPVILHNTDIHNAKEAFEFLADTGKKQAFTADLIRLISDINFKICSVLVDKQKLKTQYKTPEHPYHYALKLMLERVHMRFNAKGNYGDIMIESRGNKRDRELQNVYKSIYNIGTTSLKFDPKIITAEELIFKKKIDNVAGLQIADIIAYPLSRFAKEYFGYEVKDSTDYNAKIIEIIKPQIICDERYGNMKGYGLKLFPDKK